MPVLRKLFLTIASALVLVSCSLSSIRNTATLVPSLDVEVIAKTMTADAAVEDRVATAAAETVAARGSQNPEITATGTPVPTGTDIPTDTPLPTHTNTPDPRPCNGAAFIKDVTFPDHTVINPGARFIKTWRLMNIGSCTWTRAYELVFVGGERLDGNGILPLPEAVLPGETIDLSVQLHAPDREGTFISYWQLRNGNGDLFGIGDDNNTSFWVRIQVLKPNNNYVFDFAANYCRADWRSGAGLEPCPGSESSDDGFVILLTDPVLENRHENEPALWVHPNNDRDGWISGTFPEVRIDPYDRFRAWVGCLEGNPGCDVTFELNYRINGGSLQTYADWREIYDGDVTIIDLDLSDLAGERVQFVFTVLNHGRVAEANVFWFVPRIQEVLPTPSPQPSNTPTSTATLTITPAASNTAIPTNTLTPSSTLSMTPTLTESVMPSLTLTPTLTATE